MSADDEDLEEIDDDEEEDEEGSDGEDLSQPGKAPRESLVVEGGRTRRRALFADGAITGPDAGVGPWL